MKPQAGQPAPDVRVLPRAPEQVDHARSLPNCDGGFRDRADDPPRTIAPERERRSHGRIEVNGMYAVIGGGACKGLAAMVKDFSRRGISVLTEWRPDPGLAVWIALDGAMGPITGRVVRVDQAVLAVAFSQDEANLALIDQALGAFCGRSTR